jgi:hypothetical protein
MMRVSRQTRHEVERRFPIRVRVAVPAGGFGRQLEIMHAWLDQTCGSDGWGSAPAGFTGVVNDAVAFYFADPAFAQAFVARFCCGWRVETVDGAFTVRDVAPAMRQGAPAHRTP